MTSSNHRFVHDIVQTNAVLFDRGEIMAGAIFVLLMVSGVMMPWSPEPSPQGLAITLARYRGIGLAGTSRSQSPNWMDRELPVVFAWLRSLAAGIVHYRHGRADRVRAGHRCGPHRAQAGGSPIFYTTLGRGDARTPAAGASDDRVGQALGRLLRRLWTSSRRPAWVWPAATPLAAE